MLGLQPLLEGNYMFHWFWIDHGGVQGFAGIHPGLTSQGDRCDIYVAILAWVH